MSFIVLSFSHFIVLDRSLLLSCLVCFAGLKSNQNEKLLRDNTEINEIEITKGYKFQSQPEKKKVIVNLILYNSCIMLNLPLEV